MADPAPAPAPDPAPPPTLDLFTQLDAPVEAEPPPDSPAPPPQGAEPGVLAAAPEPPPVPPATPAAAAVSPEPERTVPLAVLLEERRKAEEREATLRDRLDKLEAKSTETPPPPAEPEPDYLDDPKGYVDAQLAKANAALKRLQDEGSKRMGEVEQQTAQHTLTRAIDASSDAFAAKTPDFKDALQHARTMRAQQIQVLRPEMKAEEIAKAVLTEEHALAVHLVRAGVDPAERIYGLAKAMGYTPRQPAPTPAAVTPAPAGVVSPDVTLNATPGQAPGSVVEEEPDALALAMTERFPRKRA